MLSPNGKHVIRVNDNCGLIISEEVISDSDSDSDGYHYYFNYNYRDSFYYSYNQGSPMDRPLGGV